MIKQIEGNAVTYALEKPHRSLLHVCNAQGVMGSGIAKEIKERVPDAFKVYKEHLKRDSKKYSLGEVSYSENFKVFNMVAQEYYGTNKRHLNYGYLASCLMNVEWESQLEGSIIEEIVIPYNMGSDRAGGDFEIVMELVVLFLSKRFDVTIVKLPQK